MKFQLYGKNGVVEADAPPADAAHGLEIIIDVVGRIQKRANDVLARARTLISHTEFEGRLWLARNMAFPDSSLDIPVGPVYRFSLRYLVEGDNPCAMFRHGTGRGMRVTLWPPLLTCEQGLLACPTAEDRLHAPGSI